MQEGARAGRATRRRASGRRLTQELLAFAAVVEIGTGLVADDRSRARRRACCWAPTSRASESLLGRCFGIALLALGLACWPGGGAAQSGAPAVRAMLVYNALIALLPRVPGHGRHIGGVLLWPAVVLHAVVALLLAWTGATRQRTTVTANDDDYRSHRPMGIGARCGAAFVLVCALALASIGTATAQGAAPAAPGGRTVLRSRARSMC